MNIIETGMVLAKIQAFDNRNVDDATILAWQEVLEPHTVQDALAAVSAYFRTNASWIMPSHIVDRVRDVEQARAREFKNGCHLNGADEERALGGTWSESMRVLNRAVATGRLTPAAYDAYQAGGQTLASVLAPQALK
ncbi:hypothetical protein QFZ79_002923 [Arthrobacter sp. V4I6]|uniref:hypothetical protein n=1 Tax=Arthrobacter sp. V4I6 TaxID=3042281 RepID=UPI002787C52A|nr:hypothetical protein [Arthrobacter sp. V4I6]MDQ0854812.1 hypothetical protein [Arthrobacter sp. V4I6]